MKYTSDAILGVSLMPEIAQPLDVRLVVDSVEELYQIPKSVAYQGMPVVHAGNGSIFVLTDKSQIDSPKGWTASYETILIKMCTEAEYKKWLANTKDNKSIDGSPDYIRNGVYYYIKEDSIDDRYLYYVSYGQFETLENSVKTKASTASVVAIAANVSTLLEALKQYDEIKENYLSDSDLKEDGRINVVLTDYYLRSDADSLFVKKSDITGEASDSGYIFVSKEEYNNKISELLKELDSTLKTDSDGSLQSISVNSVKDKTGNNTLDMATFAFNGDAIALAKQLLKLEVLTQSEYDTKLDAGTLDATKYYMTYIGDNESSGYMTRDYFEKYYINKKEAEEMFAFLKTIKSGDKTLAEIVSELAKKINASDVYTKQLANDTFQSKGNYITLQLIPDVSGKADKTDIPTKVSLLENDSHYITEHQSLEGYAKTSDIPDTSKFITSHLDISNLATKESIPTKISQLENDSKFVTISDVTNYLLLNKVIYSDKIFDASTPSLTLDLFNKYVKDTYVSKATYKELLDNYEKLIVWAKTKGFEEEES